MTPRNGDTWFEDDELVREEGILVSKAGGHEVRCEGDCAPDDNPEDSVNGEGVPGTPDDLPYDFGVENARAADEVLDSFEHAAAASWGVGKTGPAGEGPVRELGGPEQRELWDMQQPLIEESDAEEQHFAGLREQDLLAVGDASAEDAAEVLPDSPDGTSATGDVAER